MKIKHPANAGTLESSDCFISILPASKPGREIRLDSIVMTTFGDQILETVKRILDKFEIGSIEMDIKDRGAIDCVIEARVITAVCRAADRNFNWEGEDVYGQCGA